MGTRNTKLRQALVLGDCHIPFHDKAALKMVKALIAHYKFDEVISVGDISDQLAVGRFSRSRGGEYDIQKELDEVVKVASELQDCSPYSKFTVTLGNHDIRIDKKLDALRNDLDAFYIRSLNLDYRLTQIGWNVIPYKESYELTDKLHITHDFGRSGKGALLQAHSKYGTACIFGHTHKAGIWYDGSHTGPVHGYMNVGWLGDESTIDYVHRKVVSKESILGVGIVTLGPQGLYHLSFSPFIKEEGKVACCVNNEWWEVEA